jgi:hypothetical protein
MPRRSDERPAPGSTDDARPTTWRFAPEAATTSAATAPPISRRTFLARVGSVAVAAPILATVPTVQHMVGFGDPWTPPLRPEAHLAPTDFVDHYTATLRTRGTRIGASFAPEQFGASPTRTRKRSEQMAMQSLSAAVEDLGMLDLRLGLRWNSLAPLGPELSSFYEPYLDYVFSHPLVRTVCLDIGPIKTFRWPEIHLPQWALLHLDRQPAIGEEVQADSQLAALSFDHARRVIEYLGRRYAGRKPVMFSFNEPFNPYGILRWTLSEEFLEQLVGIVRDPSWFPDADIVVNSTGGANLARISRLFASLIRNDPTLAGHLVSGFDLYPFVPAETNVPILRDIVERVTQPTSDWYGEASANRRRAADPHLGFRIEVTEAQAEPFGSVRSVGDSLPYYQHVLAECIDRVLAPDQRGAPIRMFGLEYQMQRVLSGHATPGNDGILSLTRTLNHL